MNKQIEIGSVKLTVNVERTQAFYRTQELIADDCDCDDCVFYANSFVNEPIEILEKLRLSGVDLKRNLDREPSGVWCLNSSDYFFSHQAYIAYGRLIDCDKYVYEVKDRGLEIKATIEQLENEVIDFYLSIKTEKNMPNKLYKP